MGGGTAGGEGRAGGGKGGWGMGWGLRFGVFFSTVTRNEVRKGQGEGKRREIFKGDF